MIFEMIRYLPKKTMLNIDVIEAKTDLKFRFERALSSFKSKERQIFFEIKDQIISLMLKSTVSQATEIFKRKKLSAKLINNTIRILELPS